MIRKPAPQADQHRAADEERAQDQVAEAGVVRDELAQPLRGDGEDLAGLADDRGEERRLAGEQVELAQEAVPRRARRSVARRRGRVSTIATMPCRTTKKS